MLFQKSVLRQNIHFISQAVKPEDIAVVALK